MIALRLGTVLLAATSLLAQEQPGSPATPTPPSEAARQGLPENIDEYPPQVKLGIRVAAVRSAWPVIPLVVIVPDGESYIEAVAAWNLRGRYPVLIDDGSEQAREEIACFVRGFAPAKVVRWQRSGKPEGGRREGIESAVRRVWSAPLPGETAPPEIRDQNQLVSRWRAVGVVPPGVVVASPEDPAWTAALALSVGRMQPICWVSAGQNINAVMTLENASALAKQIEDACIATGLSWNNLGDELEAVALCLNSPAKTQQDASNVCATTDLIGRMEKDGSRSQGPRWAWCGQIFGSESRAAYQAMCSLFLRTKSAWLFDGYPGGDPWQKYDATEAASFFEKIKLETKLFDAPRQSAVHWRQAAASPVEADIVCVNTKGMADEFNLEPGQCRPGDVPLLTRPAMVYMVHSFSAAVPGERTTVAGRWLERGAYAYIGSVYEPFLHSFPPTPMVAARLASAFPWGAAGRVDSELWKIATFGDPLLTLGDAGPKSELELPLKDASDTQALVAAAVGAREYAEAATLLTLSGRDKEAAQLAAAVRKDEPKAFDAALAAAAVLPAFRAGDLALVLACMDAIPPERATGAQRDALWLAAWPKLQTLDEKAYRTLEKHLREDQVGRDAHELAKEMAPKLGVRAAAELINRVRDRAKTDYDRRELEAAAKRFGIRK
jgi:hypothetical protein